MAEKRSRVATFRNALLTGALLVAPLVVTVWAIGQFITLLGGTVSPLFRSYLPASLQQLTWAWDILATAGVILLLALFGYVSHYVFGKFLLDVADRFLRGIPGIGAVYNGLKQIVDTFGTQNRTGFSKVVMVQFPREGIWSIGFLTNKDLGEIRVRAGEEVWSVFVPTTPNPTSGFLLVIPRKQVVELDMSTGDAMKLIISGGAVVPPHN